MVNGSCCRRAFRSNAFKREKIAQSQEDGATSYRRSLPASAEEFALNGAGSRRRRLIESRAKPAAAPPRRRLSCVIHRNRPQAPQLGGSSQVSKLAPFRKASPDCGARRRYFRTIADHDVPAMIRRRGSVRYALENEETVQSLQKEADKATLISSSRDEV